MRKTFPLLVAGLEPPRVLEGIKHELRKYLKRERRKRLPLAVDYWDFDCRIGPDAAACRTVHVGELTTAVDVAVRENWPALYVEVLAKPGVRTRRTPQPGTQGGDAPGKARPARAQNSRQSSGTSRDPKL